MIPSPNQPANQRNSCFKVVQVAMAIALDRYSSALSAAVLPWQRRRDHPTESFQPQRALLTHDSLVAPMVAMKRLINQNGQAH